MNTLRLASLTAMSAIVSLCSVAKEHTLWSLGQKDGTGNEFALAPDKYRDFIEHDFGYEDKFFIVGKSDIQTDLPYVLPGPADTWGGTWGTAGWRTHQLNLLFNLTKAPSCDGYTLVIDLADYSRQFLPLLKISINNQDKTVQLTANNIDTKNLPKPSTNDNTTNSPSLTGNFSEATPYSLRVPLNAQTLKKGNNEVTIAILEGSWIIFDKIALTGPTDIKLIQSEGVYVRTVEVADYEINGQQPLIVDVEHLEGSPNITVNLDGRTIFSAPVEKGRYQFEAPMPGVKKKTKSSYKITCEGKTLAEGKVIRSPQQEVSPADYVDTRIGTAHSRWMIAPGPWMPFSMVKLSPDNQNPGWQAGYQPTFENIGCFSHIHEWTLSGLGIMATNGPLLTKVGDEQRPDEGYRSRINKRTERADIGYYSADLTDYGIKAEITATTRCGMELFTFPSERGDGRIIIDLKPQAEYGFHLKDVMIKKVSPTRIEGYSHQYSPGVWSNDADQDYTIHFVIEFDRPMLSMGSWLNDEITNDVAILESGGECDFAGVFATFNTAKDSVVKMRTAISPVSISNAAENLSTEVIEPFGWDFNAVRCNQVNVWNELFARINIKSNDCMEKRKFYNNMYRALCSRNIWSDVNGEWISTDGIKRKVANPSKDVMIGCDAFWNTFWNLNQFWNLVVPEWSSRWVKSQLALYDANGWLAKGPAGLNYVPVMVAEHEIPQMVSAWQMGIRDFDGAKALEAAVKMQTTPASKVFNGFAGNRDLLPYLQHHYVPHDKGRFSNSMEYSFDDWTVGQLAKALDNDSLYNIFNERGYWWQNVISDEGYCHMRNSNGEWLKDFDPFRSGANRHYVEGNAWQLTFFVPQDIPALVEKIGKERFTERLLWGFNQDEAWRYNAPNDQYWDHPVVQGNQQSMHFAYLFNFAGQPWNTQRWSRSILDRYYGSGYANAYLGDEDQGQMSAWAVMTALGLFQTDGGCAVEPMYEIASPAFEEAVIDLGGRYGRGDKFTIKAHNASRNNIYIQRATLNGRTLNSFRFPARELLKGGELVLEMGPTPNKSWGTE